MRTPVVGYATGVFDLFHIGHLNLLRNAKSMCDFLIVGVTTDELLAEYKGKQCVIPFAERCEIVRSSMYVDTVVPQEDMNKVEAWQRLRFNAMFVGDDWYKTEKWEAIQNDLEEFGVRVVYFPYTTGTSSTLINSLLEEKRQNASRSS
jgi:glycerol-3-phosphate cytidylyltransferase